MLPGDLISYSPAQPHTAPSWHRTGSGMLRAASLAPSDLLLVVSCTKKNSSSGFYWDVEFVAPGDPALRCASIGAASYHTVSSSHAATSRQR